MAHRLGRVLEQIEEHQIEFHATAFKHALREFLVLLDLESTAFSVELPERCRTFLQETRRGETLDASGLALGVSANMIDDFGGTSVLRFDLRKRRLENPPVRSRFVRNVLRSVHPLRLFCAARFPQPIPNAFDVVRNDAERLLEFVRHHIGEHAHHARLLHLIESFPSIASLRLQVPLFGKRALKRRGALAYDPFHLDRMRDASQDQNDEEEHVRPVGEQKTFHVKVTQVGVVPDLERLVQTIHGKKIACDAPLGALRICRHRKQRRRHEFRSLRTRTLRRRKDPTRIQIGRTTASESRNRGLLVDDAKLAGLDDPLGFGFFEQTGSDKADVRTVIAPKFVDHQLHRVTRKAYFVEKPFGVPPVESDGFALRFDFAQADVIAAETVGGHRYSARTLEVFERLKIRAFRAHDEDTAQSGVRIIRLSRALRREVARPVGLLCDGEEPRVRNEKIKLLPFDGSTQRLDVVVRGLQRNTVLGQPFAQICNGRQKRLRARKFPDRVENPHPQRCLHLRDARLGSENLENACRPRQQDDRTCNETSERGAPNTVCLMHPQSRRIPHGEGQRASTTKSVNHNKSFVTPSGNASIRGSASIGHARRSRTYASKRSSASRISSETASSRPTSVDKRVSYASSAAKTRLSRW